MLKIFAFLTKREGMETPAFIDYYENHHVPLITVEPTTSGPLCAWDDSDPAHTCPAQSGPDPR